VLPEKLSFNLSSKGETMCPFLNKECIKDKCEIWNNTNCAIINIACNIELILIKNDQIIEELQGIAD